MKGGEKAQCGVVNKPSADVNRLLTRVVSFNRREAHRNVSMNQTPFIESYQWKGEERTVEEK